MSYPVADYTVDVRVVMRTEARQDDRREQEANKLAILLDRHLCTCPGIVVRDVRLETYADFTLDDFYRTIEWDTFDYLTPSTDEETSG